ncbi:hypothetical protein D918_01947 [Trichuris suis]|nr:hypothetical protein D918_01947 [Trichuris suis]
MPLAGMTKSVKITWNGQYMEDCVETLRELYCILHEYLRVMIFQRLEMYAKGRMTVSKTAAESDVDGAPLKVSVPQDASD